MSWRRPQPKHVRDDRGPIGRIRGPIVLFAVAFALATGTAAFAYTTVSGAGNGQAQAVTLQTPGAGQASTPTAATLAISWSPSAGLPPGAGYLVLRSTSPGGPFAKISSGTCQQATTLVSTATSCTDSGLSAGTTYYYEVEADFYDVHTLWVSPPDAQFSGTTSPATGASDPPAATSSAGDPTVTSAASATFTAGVAGSFQATASGTPAPTFSDAAFSGCSPSVLPAGVTFSDKGLLSGTPAADATGTFTVCINAANGVGPDGTQRFTLTITSQTLVFSSPPVTGATSANPNLGPVTVRRQTGSGAPITGGALTVQLASGLPAGVTFGSTQFAASSVTSVTIPSGESTASFWFGSTASGKVTLTASSPNYVSANQTESITTAPAGLGVTPAPGGTGTPFVTCGPLGTNDTCNVTGVGAGGTAVLAVSFYAVPGVPATYSATQPSTVTESGGGTGSVTIGPAATTSSPQTVTAPTGISVLTFGPYRLTLDVGP